MTTDDQPPFPGVSSVATDLATLGAWVRHAEANRRDRQLLAEIALDAAAPMAELLRVLARHPEPDLRYAVAVYPGTPGDLALWAAISHPHVARDAARRLAPGHPLVPAILAARPHTVLAVLQRPDAGTWEAAVEVALSQVFAQLAGTRDPVPAWGALGQELTLDRLGLVLDERPALLARLAPAFAARLSGLSVERWSGHDLRWAERLVAQPTVPDALAFQVLGQAVGAFPGNAATLVALLRARGTLQRVTRIDLAPLLATLPRDARLEILTALGRPAADPPRPSRPVR